MWPDSTTKPELQWLFNCQQFAASEPLHITSHAVCHDGFRRRLAGLVVWYAGVDVSWWQIVHRVVWFARDLSIYLEKTRQLKLVSCQRRERLQYHQSFTPAENTRPSFQRGRQLKQLVVTVNRVNRSWQWIKRLSKLRCRSRLMINWPANQKCRILNEITWQWQSKFIIIIYRTFAGPLMSCRLCISMLQTVPSSDVVCIGTYTIYVEHLM